MILEKNNLQTVQAHFDRRPQVMTGDVISRCHTSQRSTIVFVQNAS